MSAGFTTKEERAVMMFLEHHRAMIPENRYDLPAGTRFIFDGVKIDTDGRAIEPHVIEFRSWGYGVLLPTDARSRRIVCEWYDLEIARQQHMRKAKR